MKEAASAGLAARLAARQIELERLRSGLSADQRAALERRLRGAAPPAHEVIPRRPPRPAASGEPTSFAQQRLWFLEQLEPGTARHNVPTATRMAGRLDLGALGAAFAALVRRHEVLRTTFAIRDGEPVQIIAPAGSPGLARLGVVDLGALPAALHEPEAAALGRAEARRPFDLARGPLVRATVIRLSAGEHLLHLNLHHIVTDGWSDTVLVADLVTLYRSFARPCTAPAETLPPLPVQYADFAAWQRGWLSGERLARQLDYWRRRLAGLEALDLPLDRPRPAVQTFRGARHLLVLPEPVLPALAELGRRHGTTLFMTLLAGCQALLARLSGQTDIAVGTPVANRDRPELERVVGFFVNTLVLRSDLGGEPPAATLLARVREAALGAYAHQDVPFEKLVEDLMPERDLSRNPLFQVVCVLQNQPPDSPDSEDLACEPLDLDSGTASFDLTFLWHEEAGRLYGMCEYNTDLFDRSTVLRWANYYESVLGALAAPAGPPLASHPLLDAAARQQLLVGWSAAANLADLPLLPAAERQQLLAEWNDAPSDYPRQATLAGLFAAAAARSPDAAALVTATVPAAAMTWAELDRASGRLADRLAALGVGPEVVVGLCLPRSPALVVAMLACARAGGAYLPLDPGDPAERLAWLLADAGAAVVLTAGQAAAALPAGSFIRLDLDGDDPAAAGSGQPAGPAVPPAPLGEAGRRAAAPAACGGERLACLVYTSGSTGTPKAVAVLERGIVRLVRGGGHLRLAADRTMLHLSAPTFDVATGEVWGALANGARLVVMPPGVPSLDELQHAITRHRVTTMLLTAALFHQIVEEAPALLAEVAEFTSGGEALSPAHAEWAARELPGSRLFNCYGPTEDTTIATSWRVAAPPAGASVPIGRPIAGTEVYVLDRQGRLVPPGVAGELALGGDGLARGYWRRPELTAERFRPHPFAAVAEAGTGRAGGRLYLTGDRVRFRADGNLEFLGRIDRQVKLRGMRIEPGEVEAALAAHPRVGRCAVVVREDRPGDRRLVAYVVAQGGGELDPVVLQAELESRLPRYLLPSSLVVLPALPLTAHGKIDWRELPAPAAEPRTAGVIAPRNAVEELLVGIWAAVLGLERQQVGIDDDFFALGGNSLLATQAVARAQRALEVEVPLRWLFENPAVAGLAAAVESAAAARLGDAGAAAEAGSPAAGVGPPLVPAPRGQPLPLSFAQQRLWFLEQLQPGTALYNVPAGARLARPIDPGTLGAALAALIRRHEALRTTFEDRHGQPVQVIAPAVAAAPSSAAPVPLLDLGSLPTERREREAAARGLAEARLPFDLARGPLVRAVLLRLAPAEHLLLLTVHHIVADGWSAGILMRELTVLYRAAHQRQQPPAGLPPLRVQYADFAVWQRRWLSGERLARQLVYWRRQLAGLGALDLPLDRPRPAVESFRGAQLMIALPAAAAAALAALSREQGVTLFMTLLAGFQALLARLSGQTDIAVGTPAANRGRPELDGVIGFFVNTLVLRTDLGGEPPAAALLARVREVALGAYAHQDAPFEKLVEELMPERDLSRNPLFQVMCALQNQPSAAAALEDLALQAVALDSGMANFDLTFLWHEEAGRLVGMCEYNPDLFDRSTVVRWAGCYESLLGALAAPAGPPLAGHPLLDAAARQQLLVEWNDQLRVTPAMATWFEQLSECRLENPDGPSESRLAAVHGLCGRSAERPALPPIGRPIGGSRIQVLDQGGRPVPIGVAGALHIGGECLERAHCGRPELTAERFVPDPLAGFAGEPGARLYRTGDLGRWRADGTLEVLERCGQQVRVRGIRLEPGEIEAALDRRSLPATPETPAAPAINGRVAPRTPLEALLVGIWAAVLGLEPEAVGVKDNFFKQGGHSLLGTRLMSRVRSACGVEVPMRTLFETPTVAGLAAAVDRARRAAAAAAAGTGSAGTVPPLAARQRPAEVPLSFAQERLWFLDQIEPGGTAYNLPLSVGLRGRLVPAALAAAVAALVRRHEALRTRFPARDGRPRQEIAPPAARGSSPALPVIDLAALPAAARRAERDGLAAQLAAHRFDLARGPLAIWALLRVEAGGMGGDGASPPRGEHVFVVVQHHIITDGWSMGVMLRELAALYTALVGGRGAGLAPSLQYADFALWQRELLDTGGFAPQLAYWRERLGGELPALDLPGDRPRASSANRLGGSAALELGPELSARAGAAARRAGATPFMLLLAAWKALLHRLSGQDDLLVGVPIAGRNRAELEGTLGFFVNTLVLRSDLGGNPRFGELVARVREAALGAYDHQDLPFERLVAELQPERDIDRTPLFQVFFNHLNLAREPIVLPGLTLEPVGEAPPAAKFDLSIYLAEQSGSFRFELLYDAGLFAPERIAEMLAQLELLLAALLADPELGSGIDDVPLITSRAAAVLPDPAAPLAGGWLGGLAAPGSSTGGPVHELVARQARRHPSRPAVVAEGEAWSYGELAGAANRLARHLAAAGLAAGDVVAIAAERRAALAWAVLGTLGAGCAFLLLDADHPAARRAAMLRMAGARALVLLPGDAVLEPELAAEFGAWPPGRVVEGVIAARLAARGGPDPGPPAAAVGPWDAAYVAFTSGSTGEPKAILGPQAPLTHFLAWQAATFGLAGADRFCLLSGLGHDPLLRDLLAPLALGATLCVPPDGSLDDAERLVAWLAAQRVTVAHLTPAFARMLAQGVPPPAPPAAAGAAALPDLRFAFLGGDRLRAADLAELRRLAPGAEVVNFYGATETPQAMGWFTVPAAVEGAPGPLTLPLGRGIDSVQLLVRNRAGSWAGIGELGEIVLRTPYLARGYLGDEGLSQERFLTDPAGGANGERLYRSGDLGRYSLDGGVEFAGRADRQVKIRGLRIEPAEIEAALAADPAVAEAAVVVTGGAEAGGAGAGGTGVVGAGAADAGAAGEGAAGGGAAGAAAGAAGAGRAGAVGAGTVGAAAGEAMAGAMGAGGTAASDALLIAFFVPRPDAAAAGGSLEGEMRLRLARRLPRPMLPAAILRLDRMPLTPNRKIDRRALLRRWEAERADPARASSHAAPRGPVEEVVAGIWEEVLGPGRTGGRVGVHDNFFALGGHSLLAAQVVSRLRRVLAVEVPLRRMFESPTVASLARAVAALRAARAAAAGEAGAAALAAPPPLTRSGSRAEPPPLSFAQESLWLFEQLTPGTAAYNMPAALRLGGPLRPRALAAALAEMACRHETLRTAVVERASLGLPGPGAVQVIAPPSRAAATGPVLPLIDLSGLPAVRREAAARRLAAAEAARPFELGQGPLWRARLLRLAAGDQVLLLTAHHIICDGWSLGVMAGELGALYGAFAAGRPSPLPELVLQYADYALWQRRWLEGPALAAQLRWWRQRLTGAPALLALPTDRPRPLVASHRGARLGWQLPAGVAAALGGLARGHGATPFMLLLAGLQALLGRLSGQQDLVVGLMIAHRNRVELEPLIGFFVNMLALRAAVAGELPFRGLLEQARETTLAALDHQEVPFDRLLSELRPERAPSHAPLFQVVCTLQDVQLAPQMPGLHLAPFEVGGRTARFDLTLAMATLGGEGIGGYLEYDAGLFDATTAARLLGGYERLLAAVAAEPELAIGELPLLSAAERHQLFLEHNDSARELPGGLCVHELVLAQAARTPAAVAVAAAAGGGGGAALRYGELATQSAGLARRLMRAGVGPEVRVAVCVGRAPRLLVALLGVLRAGGAYVPLDPTHPRQRLGHVLADSGAAVLLAERVLLATLPPTTARLVLLDGADGEEDAAGNRPEGVTGHAEERVAGHGGEGTGWGEEAATGVPRPAVGAAAAAARLLPAVGAENLAYVIYTSGSTGHPKGVEISHRAVVNYLRSMAERPGLGAGDVMMAVTTLSFDIAVSELWLPLAVGARIALVGGEAAGDAAELGAAIDAAGATCMQATPATWSLLLEGGWTGRAALRAWCGGEALPRVLAGKLQERVAEVWNLYGPTETTVWSALLRVEAGPGAVPVGRPLANTALHLLDAAGRPVPWGTAGEVAIGGAGLARGYHGRPELTAESFLPDPFGPVGGRLYRTGDLARRLADGTLEFLGRCDHQVKVRGFRIELGEIEAVLGRHPAVRECVVVARREEAGHLRLVAYVVASAAAAATLATAATATAASATAVPSATAATSETAATSVTGAMATAATMATAAPAATAAVAATPAVTAGELRAWLAERLPAYMVPGTFVALAGLPLSASGKVDRKALPAPPPRERAAEGPDRGEAPAGGRPRTPAEAVLARVWEEVLGVSPVGVENNFFELGGDSILSLQVASRALAAGLRVRARDLFRHQTVAQLAAAVEAVAGPPPAELAHLGVTAADLAALQRDLAAAAAAPPAAVAAPSVPARPAAAHLPGIAAVYPLTPMQEGILFQCRLAASPDQAELYVVQYRCTLRGTLDLATFRGAWQEVIDRHAVLRASFHWTGLERPLQAVHSRLAVPLAVEDWRRLAAGERADRLARLRRADRRRGFDVRQAPLLRITLARIAEDEQELVFSYHHLLLDGWSTPLLFGELLHLYAALAAGERPELPAVRPFQDYVEWLERQDAAGTEAFWRRELAGFTAATPVPLEALAAAARGEPGRGYTRRHHLLGAAETGALRRLARRHHLTLGTLVQGAWALLLARHAAAEEVLFGAISSGRPAELEGAETMLGLFIATLPVRVAVPAAAPLLPWLAELQEHLARLRELEHCPLADVQRWSAVPRGGALFDSLVIVENYPLAPGAAPGGAESGLHFSGFQAVQNTNYPLSLVAAMRGDHLHLRLAFDAGRHAAPPVERALCQLATLLVAMAAAGGGDGAPGSELAAAGSGGAAAAATAGPALGDLSALGPAERHQLLREWSDTDRAPAIGPPLHRLFEQRAAAAPAAIALVLDELALSYGEVEARASRLAAALRRLGIGERSRHGKAGRETLVALALPRSPWLPIAMLAVWKAGGALLPLDPGYPLERLAFMLADSGAGLLLADPALSGRLPTSPGLLQATVEELWAAAVGVEPGAGAAVAAGEELGAGAAGEQLGAGASSGKLGAGAAGEELGAGAAVEELWAAAAGVERAASDEPPPGGLAYVIYTSGSTGTPKGVMVEHRGLANLVREQLAVFGIGRDSRVLQLSSASFDASVSEIWTAWAAGAALVMLPEGALAADAGLVRRLRDQAVSVATFSPSLLAALPWADLPALATLVSAGEAANETVLARWAPGRRRVINGYGPTEFTIGATLVPWPPQPARQGGEPLLGRPIANARIRLLDARQQPVAIGAAGEIGLAGIGLARGYLGRPELTAAAFLPDPWSDAPGGRLYRTGDLGVWTADGRLVYLGRRDAQVKVRGFRIETGEVEAALARHPEIQSCAVVARRDASGQGQLVAYVVAVPAAYVVTAPSAPLAPAAAVAPPPAAAPLAARLRAFLQRSLPEPMVPGRFVELPTLPRTPSGKLDRRALPDPDRAAPRRSLPPESALERWLAGLWSEVLGVSGIGVDDDFFQLGGHSLSGATVVGRLQQALGEIVHVVAMYDAPTVGALAGYLAEHYPDAVGRLVGGAAAPPGRPSGPAPPAGEPAGGHAPAAPAGPQELAELRAIVARGRGVGAPDAAATAGLAAPAADGALEAGQPVSVTGRRSSELGRSVPGAGRPMPRGGPPRNPPALFVLSPPRSGSTLLRVMLAGHPQLFAPPELELLSFDTLAGRRAAFAGRNRFWLEGVVRALMEIHRCEAGPAEALVAAMEAAGAGTQELYRRLQEWVAPRLLVDKTPSYALDPQVLARAERLFDGARYIHLLRHPQAMIRSFEEARVDQVFFRFAHRFSRRQLAELVWAACQENILGYLDAVEPGRHYRLRFEDLVAGPEDELRRLCAWLEIDFDPAMARPYGEQHEEQRGEQPARMTDGIHPWSRMLGDVKFHQHLAVDAAAAGAWRESMRGHRLGRPAAELAARLGYGDALPASSQPPAASPSPAVAEPPLAGLTVAGPPPLHALAGPPPHHALAGPPPHHAVAAGPAVRRRAAALVPLQPRGDLAPLVCMPPAGGDALCYRDLALALGSERPVYGLQAEGVASGESPLARVEDIAERSLAVLRDALPAAPRLHLLGWSFGGVVAYEMACRLAAAGRATALVAILDATPEIPPAPDGSLPQDDADLLAELFAPALATSAAEIRALPAAARLAQLFARAATAGTLPPGLDLAHTQRLLAVYQASQAAARAYRPGPYAGRLLLIRPALTPERRVRETDLGWGRLAAAVEVHEVAGRHDDLIAPAHAAALAECLRRGMAEPG